MPTSIIFLWTLFGVLVLAIVVGVTVALVNRRKVLKGRSAPAEVEAPPAEAPDETEVQPARGEEQATSVEPETPSLEVP